MCDALEKHLRTTSLAEKNWGLLSKTVLYDDSNFGNSSHLNDVLVEAAWTAQGQTPGE